MFLLSYDNFKWNLNLKQKRKFTIVDSKINLNLGCEMTCKKGKKTQSDA